ncbi:YDG domain-containing protein [Sphingobium sp. B12D2B]|uniref:YDG domain-containing protein n=1 Tax=Sphingobium sp. B12D2B TaxID=2940577 RepID=UPI00222573CD|nr:YDG domain-containing protein [Sphingobium sp. B12D2B]MCW2351805.1 filamentous hemagglutinin family protein [Sphingobium sp. B12D2B]
MMIKTGSDSRRRMRCGASGLALMAALSLAVPVQANPAGGVVVAGDAVIAGQGTGSVTINQSSGRAILDWQSFSVGTGENVRFVQPGKDAIAVNRVTGADASQILGNLSANGQLVLINRNGIAFGKSAVVDVAGLVATTADIDAEGFMATGALSFSNGARVPGAGIVNEGRITVRDAGLAALVAPSVRNSGVIVADMGRVALGAGTGFVVDLYGDGMIKFAPDGAIQQTLGDGSGALVDNSGTVQANGGRVLLTASAAREVVNASVNSTGIIRAEGIKAKGGTISLTGSGHIASTGLVSADSAQGQGGQIAISGGSVALGGLVTASGKTGGNVAVTSENLLSLADAVQAVGTLGTGGNVTYMATRVIETDSGFTNVSGLTHGGKIKAVAATDYTSSGSYLARGSYGRGGRIDLTGEDTVSLLGATLSAGGQAQGGLIRIGGAFQGGKTPDQAQPYYRTFLGRWGNDLGELAHAGTLFVGDGTVIDVSSKLGEGGTAVLWSDKQTTSLGAIDARGALPGSVEISSAGELRKLDIDHVETGPGGHLLLDPKNITIGSDVVASTWTYSSLLRATTSAVRTSQPVSDSGYSVALNAAGSLLVVGAPQDDGLAGNSNMISSGAVYLFSVTASDFSGATLLGVMGYGYTGGKNVDVSQLEGGDYFGSAVSLNATGNRLAVGARYDDGAGNAKQDSGAVYLYSFTDAAYSGAALQGRIGHAYTGGKNIALTADTFDNIGAAVSLNSTGNRLAIGAPGDAGAGNSVANSGAVYLVSFSDTSFTGGAVRGQMGRGYSGTGSVDVTGIQTGTDFGTSVALNGAGDRIAVGATENGISSGTGAVFLYSFADTNFSAGSLSGMIGKGFTGGKNIDLSARLGAGDWFGASVALNAAGNVLAVGSMLDDGVSNGATDNGAIYLFNFTDGSFSGGTLSSIFGQGYSGANDRNVTLSNGWLGRSVALNAAGNRLAAGAPAYDQLGNTTTAGGAVALFQANALGTAYADASSSTMTLSAIDVAARLAAGTTVTLQASNDITVNSAITVSGNPSSVGALTLQAGRSVILNANITTQNGNLTIIAHDVAANGVNAAQRDAGAAGISMASNAAINVGTGTARFEMRTGAGVGIAGYITLSSVDAGKIVIYNGGPATSAGVTLNGAAVLKASGTGTAIEIAAPSFTNNSSAGAATLQASSGRWLVWTENYANDKLGGLTYNFKQYAATYSLTAPPTVQGTGNGVLYQLAPQISASLGAVSKVYDGDLTAALTTSNFALTGAMGGDTITLSGISANYDNKNRGDANRTVSATIGGVTAMQGSATVYGYSLASSSASNSGSTITARPLTISVTAQNKIYDGLLTAGLNTATLNNVVSGDTVSVGGGTGAFLTKAAESGKTVVVSGFTLSGADAANYTVTQPTGVTADITKRALTVSVTAQNKVYDGSLGAVLNTAVLNNVVSGDTVLVGGGTGAFLTKVAETGKTVAISGFTLSGADSANYTVTQPTGVTADITKRALTISVTAENKVYDGSLTAGLGAATLNNLVSGDMVSVAGGSGNFLTKTAENGKTVTISGFALSGADAANYTVTQPTGVTADITKRALTIGVTAQNKIYDGLLAAALDTATLNNVVSGDTVSVGGGTGAFLTKAAENGKTVVVSGFTLSGADSGNYTVTQPTGVTASITKRALTINVTAESKVYDGVLGASLNTATLNDIVGGDAVSVAGGTGAFLTANAENSKTVTVSGFTLAGADSANYTLTQPTGITANITKRPLTINVTAQNKVYDGDLGASLNTPTLTNVVSGDAVSVGGGTGAFLTKVAETGKTVAISGFTLSGADSANYTVTQPTAVTADITKRALTISVTAENKVYDGSLTAGLGAATLNNLVSGDTVTAVGGTGTFLTKTAENGKTVMISGFALSGADSANYTLAQPTGLTANITKRALTIAVTAQNKEYDGGLGATLSTASLNNTVNGDDISVGGGTGTFLTKTAEAGKTVAISGFILAGTDSGNYTVTQPTGVTADITKRALTINVMAESKVYDGSLTAGLGAATLNNLVSGDMVSAAGGSGTFLTKTAENGKTVMISGFTLSGADSANYTVAQPTGVTADISKRALTITVTAQNKTYDGSLAAALNAATLTNVINGDTVAVGGGTGAFLTKTAEDGKTVTISGYTLSGLDAGNYTVSQPTGVTADIARRALTISVTAHNKVYDGSLAAGLNVATLNNTVSGDTVSVGGGTGTFLTKTAEDGKTVTVAGFILSGADSANYTVTQPTGVTADITKRALTVSVTAQNKVYDGLLSAALTGATLNNTIGGDDISLTGGTGAFLTKAAETGKTVTISGFTLSGADAVNYTVAQPTGVTADITKRALTISVTAQNKVYDGALSAALNSATLNNIVNGDAVLVGGGTGVFLTKMAGDGKAVTISGYSLSGADADNYSVTQPTGVTANISKRDLTIAGADAVNRVYDGTNVVELVGNLENLVAGDEVSFLSKRGTMADKAADSGKQVITNYRITGADDANYTLVQPTQNVDVDIAKALLTLVSPQALDREYDGTTSIVVTHGGFSGAVSGDSVGIDSVNGSISSKNIGTYSVVTQGVLNGSDAANYDLRDPALSATIGQKTITGSLTGAITKVYDGTTDVNLSPSSYVLSGVIASDVVRLAGEGAYVDKNVGGAVTVRVTNTRLEGGDASNYKLLASASVEGVGEITARQLTIADAKAIDRTYDGTTAIALEGRLVDLIDGDIVALNRVGSVADKNAGQGKLVTTGYSLAGADARNYVIIQPSAPITVNIGRAVLTFAGQAVDRDYDTTRDIEIRNGQLGNIIGLDDVGVAQVRGLADSRSAGTHNVAAQVQLSGVDRGNYDVVAPTLTAQIRQKEIGGALVGPISKVYDGGLSVGLGAGNYALSGVLGSDDVVFAGSGTGTFADRNAGTAIRVTSTGSLAGADSGNYRLASTTVSIDSGSITARQLTVLGADAVDRVYNGTTLVQLTGDLDDLISGDVVNLNRVGSVGDKNAANGKLVTTGYTLSGADSGNYVLVQPTAPMTVDIGRATLTFTGQAVDRDYDATRTVAIRDGQLGNILGTDDVRISNVIGEAASKNAGPQGVAAQVELSGADRGNYDVVAPNLMVEIRQKDISGALVGLISKVYDGNVAVSLAAGSYALNGVLATDDVAFNGSGTGTFAGKDVGSAIRVTSSGTLSGVDASNYRLASTAVSSDSGVITARQLTVVNADAMDRTYNGTTLVGLTGGLQNLVGGDTVTLGGTGSIADKNAGLGKLVTAHYELAGTDNHNYVLVQPSDRIEVDIARATLTFTGEAVDRDYDATRAIAIRNGQLADIIGNDDVGFMSVTGQAAEKDAGRRSVAANVTLTGADKDNYDVVASPLSVEIRQKQISASLVGPISKVYDGTTTAVLTPAQYTLTGVLGGDMVVFSGSNSASFASKDVGSDIRVMSSGSLTGTDADNYMLASPLVTFDGGVITKALLTVADAVATNRAYDSTRSVVIGGRLEGVFGGDSVVLGGSGTIADKNVGTYQVAAAFTLGGADANNYEITQPTNVSVDISRHMLTPGSVIIADKVYDGGLGATVSQSTLSGIFNGDDVRFVSGTGTFLDKNVGDDKAVTLANVVLGGTDAGNYGVDTSSVAKGRITAAQLTVTGSRAVDRVYDGTAAVVLQNGSLAGLIDADTVTFSGGGNMADKGAGTGKRVTGAYSLGGADAANYVLVQPTDILVTISPREISAMLTGSAAKVYDGTDSIVLSADNYALTGALDGDRVTLSGAGRYADKNVGTDKDVVVNGTSLSGADAANYKLASSSISGKIGQITPATLIVEDAAAIGRSYDGTRVVNLAGTLRGRVGTDVVTLGGIGTLDDKDVGTDKAVSTSYTIDGIDAGNYQLVQPTGLSATITARILTLAGASVADKVYDGTVQATMSGGTLTGIYAGDDVRFTTGTASFTDKNVGTDKVVTVAGSGLTGADAANYALAPSRSFTASIKPAALILLVDDKNRVAGGPDPVFTYRLDGLVGADNVDVVTGVSFASAGVGAAPVGRYSIEAANATAQNYTIRYAPGTLSVVPDPNAPEPGNPTPSDPRTFDAGRSELNRVLHSALQFDRKATEAEQLAGDGAARRPFGASAVTQNTVAVRETGTVITGEPLDEWRRQLRFRPIAVPVKLPNSATFYVGSNQ